MNSSEDQQSSDSTTTKSAGDRAALTNSTASGAPAAPPRGTSIKRPLSRGIRFGLSLAVGLFALAIGGLSVHFYRDRQRRAVILRDLPNVNVSVESPEMVKTIASARADVVANPYSGNKWGRFGSVLLAQEFFMEAAACFARAEEFDQLEVRWPYLRAACLARNDRETALSCFRRAAALRDDLGFIEMPLVEILLFEGSLDEAESYLQRVAKVAPNHPRFLLGLARLAFQRGQLDDALRWATQASGIAGPRRDIHLLLCQIYQQQENTAAVEGELTLLESLPEPPVDNAWDDPFIAETARFKTGTKWALMMAQELMTMGRPSDAVRLLLQNRAERSDNFNMILLLGRAYLQSGQFAEASRTLERAQSLNPDYAAVHFELGNLAAMTAHWNEAIEHYHEALQRDPNFGVAYQNLGISQRAIGNKEAALEAFREACRRLPQVAASHRDLGDLLLEIGDREDAAAHLRRASELDPNDPQTKLLLENLQRE